jgi:hypothetical protein
MKAFVTTGFRLHLLEVGTVFTLDKRKWRVEQKWIDMSTPDYHKSSTCAPKIGGQFQTSKGMLKEFDGDTDVVIAEGYPVTK